MKKLLFLTLVALTALGACKKEDLEINYSNSGELSVQLLDVNEAPIVDATLLLTPSEAGAMGIDVSSDENGICNFGQLPQDSYVISGHNIIDAGLNYSFAKEVQVISSEDKQISLVPSDYSGTVSLYLEEELWPNTTPLRKGIKIALVERYEDFKYWRTSLAEISEYIVKEIVADGTSKKYVFENIPYGEYMVMAYTDLSYYEVMHNYTLEVREKDEVVNRSFEFDAEDIAPFLGDQTFFVQKRITDPATNLTETTPYDGCRVLVVSQDAIQILGEQVDYETAVSMAYGSELTDVEGKVTFPVPMGKRMYACYFSADKTYLGLKSFWHSSFSTQSIILEIK